MELSKDLSLIVCGGMVQFCNEISPIRPLSSRRKFSCPDSPSQLAAAAAAAFFPGNIIARRVNNGGGLDANSVKNARSAHAAGGR